MRKKISSITKDQLTMLISSYGSDSAVARRLECSRQMVHHMKKSFGIDPAKKRNNARNKKLFLDHLKGVSGVSISKKYKISTSQTYRIIKKMEKTWKQKTKEKKSQMTLVF